MPTFVHLVNHSEYSMLRSTIRIDDIVGNAKRDAEGSGSPAAAALTDRGNMFGAPELRAAANRAGVKPIYGCELIYAPGEPGGVPGADIVWLLAENDEGYRNLVDLVSQGCLNEDGDEPVVDWTRMAERSEGLFALYGGRRSHLGKALLCGNAKLAKERTDALRGLFDRDHLFLAIQDNGARDDRTLIARTTEFADAEGIQVVATGDNHYVRREDRQAWRVLRCIARRETLAGCREEWPGELHCRAAEEMERLFRDRPDAIANTAKIADACNVIIEMDVGDRYWPRFPIPEGFADADEYLAHLAWERAPKRYPEMTEEVRTRIQYELDMMKRMDVANYMLIVQDFIVWAKENGVPVGPGRGSAPGSAVAYVLGVTDVDPMKYGLLFERFLNPERVSMPDIDTDFADSGRAKVIEYVSEKYGRDCVGQMATYGKLKAKAVLNDVGSALGVDRKEIAVVTKLIPPLAKGLKAPAKKKHEDDVYADEIQEVRDTFVNGTELYRTIWEISLKLEGLARQPGLHAAAVIIAPRPLRELAPLYKDPTSHTPAIQYDKTYAESVGFLKMDFLGLRALSTITDACEMIRENHGVELDMDNIDIADPETYRLLQEGRTVAVFQFGSAGMRNYLRQLKPTSIFELIAMNALYRPGPMDSIPTYISRKNGREPVDCYDPRFEPILGETCGLIVYQEQIMELAREAAGFSLGEGDLLRRAMAKKKGVERFEGRFKDGAARRGFSRETAERLWDELLRAAANAFPKAHSTAYALIAFQTAFLKAHYPGEFAIALGESDNRI